MVSESVIQVSNLGKVFQVYSRREGILGGLKDLFNREHRPLVAVDKITFSVQRGEMIGFIGPNGAGKSTTIKMLTGILKPSSGEITVLGFDPFRERKRYSAHIGVVFGQRTQLWWDIAVIESFNLLSHIYRVPQSEYRARLKQLTDILQLQEVLHTPVRKLSLGQRLRCDLAASLLHGPKLLFLDEPTIGVDAVAKLAIRAFLRKINREFGTTTILTTHDLVEIEELCQRIIIIDKGKLVYDGSLEAIRTLPGLQRKVRIDFTAQPNMSELETILPNNVSINRDEHNPNCVLFRFDSKHVSAVELIKKIIERFEVADLSIQEPEIEEIIIRIYTEGIAITEKGSGVNGIKISL